MLLKEITPAAIVILVSGVVSILALLVSKLGDMFTKPATNASIIGFYECGFIGKRHEFSYSNENAKAVSMFLVLELMTVWALFCCIVHTIEASTISHTFLRYTISMLLIMLLFAYKVVFRSEKSA